MHDKLLQDGEVSNTLTQRAFEVLDRSGADKITHADLDAVRSRLLKRCFE